jgi:tRNA dimethylallyltransferase
MSTLPRLIVILGPTATGKSALGIALAEKLGGEVLVCDSTQVYRRFDIGTAKISASEQRGIPHHLFDLVDAEEVFTAGDFRRRALDVLADISRRKKVPIITAGTGLYLRALLLGLSDAPERSEELRDKLRQIVDRRGPEHLHRILARKDPANAARIAPRDTQKIIRAIEMRILAGKPVTEIHMGNRGPLEGYDVVKIGLLPPRPALYARIDSRVEAMIAAGWLEEVRELIATAVPSGSKPFQFIGYADLREHLAGRLTIQDAIPRIQQATRRFAKRQITWFRREPNVHWVSGFGGDDAILSEALAAIQTVPH